MPATPSFKLQVLFLLDHAAQVLTSRWTGWCPNRLVDVVKDAAETDAVYSAALQWLQSFTQGAPSLTAWERNRSPHEVLHLVQQATDFLRDCLVEDGALDSATAEDLKTRRRQRILALFEGGGGR